MKATGVVVRFLSLLDVALMLLGVLMVILTYSDMCRRTEPSERPGSLAELADVGFIYLLAGWQGEQNGRCYLLNSPNGEIGREISTKSKSDIEDVIASRERTNPVVLLLFSDDGWYSAWDTTKLSAIEQTWQVKVIPVYNVRLSRKEKL